MRVEVVEATRALADPEYLQRVWIRGGHPHEGLYDDLTTNIQTLFDDARVLPNPHRRVGFVLYPNEVEALHALGELLDPLINELGDADDTPIPQPSTVARNHHQGTARLQALRSNDNA